MSTFDHERMKLLLEQSQAWPGSYSFKFIVPPSQEAKVRALVPDAQVSVRPSRTGKYLAITLTCEMRDPEAVLAVHAEAAQIEGLISL